MMRGNLNFDCLDLRDRLGDAVLVQWIYTQHLEWDQSTCRITNTVDRKKCHSWRGDTKVAGICLTQCWTKGQDWAVANFFTSRAFSLEELDINSIKEREPGVDMICPYRVQIGVLAGDRA